MNGPPPAPPDPLILSWVLYKCSKPDCRRQVKAGVVYCCEACSAAAGGAYEIDRHSDFCDQRHAERGDAEMRRGTDHEGGLDGRR